MTRSIRKAVGTRQTAPLWSIAQGADGRLAHFGRGLTNSFLQQEFSTVRFSYETDVVCDSPDARHALAEMLADFAGTGDGIGSGHHADRAVMEVIDFVATEHLAHGRCFAELHTQRPKDEPDDHRASGPYGLLRLTGVPGWTTRTRLGRLRQRTPVGGWKSLDDAHLVQFTLPHRLGRQLHTVSRLLAKVESTRPDDSSFQARMKPRTWDYSAHVAGQRRAQAIITTSIGWDGRSSFLNKPSDSYALWRDLKFRRTWVRIATSTIETLNSITSDPALLDAPFRFAVKGLPTDAELTAGMAALRDGSESVDAIRRRLVQHPRWRAEPAEGEEPHS